VLSRLLGVGGSCSRRDPPDLVERRLAQRLLVERSRPREQLVEQHTQGVDFAAGVDVQPAQLRLLGAHVERGAHELREGGVERLVGELLAGGLGDAEVDHLGHGHAVVEGDHHVRRLDIAVDDALLMGVLHGLADLDEEPEPIGNGELGLVAVVGNRDAADQLHHEVGAARIRGAGVEDLGDVRVIHQREGLPLGLEPGDHLAGVHARLDDLQRDLAADGLGLLGHVHDAHAAFADHLQELVGADGRARALAHGGRGDVGCGGGCEGRRGEEAAGRVVMAEQVLDLGPEPRIRAAGRVEEGRPLRGVGQLGGGVEEALPVVCLCGHGAAPRHRVPTDNATKPTERDHPVVEDFWSPAGLSCEPSVPDTSRCSHARA
jgi:hypothetical protein